MLGLDYDSSGEDEESTRAGDDRVDQAAESTPPRPEVAPAKKRAATSLLPSADALFSSVEAPKFLKQEKSAELEYEVKKPKAAADSVPSATNELPDVAMNAPKREIREPFEEQTEAKKKETTRQKNNRKEKLGQAKFTIKSERECPDIWRGKD